MQRASKASSAYTMRVSGLSVLPLLLLLAASLLSSLPAAWAQGSSASTATPLVNNQVVQVLIEAFEYQQVTQWFSFTIPPSSFALQQPTDLLLACVGFGGQTPAYLGLLVTDPTGAQYSDNEYDFSYSVTSAQITSNSSLLQLTSQQLYAGEYLIQVTSEAVGYPYLGGDTWYQLSLQLQPRTLVQPGVATPLALSTPDASFPEGAFAHADFNSSGVPFYLIVTTDSSNSSSSLAPWLFWLPVMQGDFDMQAALLGYYWLGSSAMARAPYQLLFSAGDGDCGYYDYYYNTTSDEYEDTDYVTESTCWVHFTVRRSAQPRPQQHLPPRLSLMSARALPARVCCCSAVQHELRLQPDRADAAAP